MNMNDIQRKCANCCAATADGTDCMNLMGVEFSPESVCAQHKTPAEFDADMAVIQLLRRIRLPLKPGESRGDETP